MNRTTSLRMLLPFMFVTCATAAFPKDLAPMIHELQLTMPPSSTGMNFKLNGNNPQVLPLELQSL